VRKGTPSPRTFLYKVFKIKNLGLDFGMKVLCFQEELL